MMEIKDSLGTKNLIEALTEPTDGLQPEMEQQNGVPQKKKRKRRPSQQLVSGHQRNQKDKKEREKHRSASKREDSSRRKYNSSKKSSLKKKSSLRKKINKKRRSRRKKSFLDWLMIVLGIIVMMLVICVTVTYAIYSSGKNKLQNMADETTMQGDDTEAELRKLYQEGWQDNWIALDGEIYEYDKDAINILFLGVDNKEANGIKGGKLKKEADLSENRDPGQTDTIFLASINPKAGEVKIIGVPRNSMMYLDKYDEDRNVSGTYYDQICLQYPWAGGGEFGIEKTKEQVSKLFFGVPIHGSFLISLGAVPIVTDMLGGVDIEVIEDLSNIQDGIEGSISNEEAAKFTLGAKLHLTGEEAMFYVQRRDICITGSPTQRLKRQKQFVLELFKQTKDRIKTNPKIIVDIYNAMDDYMINTIGLDEATYIATQVINCGFDSEDMFSIEGEDVITANVHLLDENGNPKKFNDFELDKDSLKSIAKEVFFTKVDIKNFNNTNE